MFARSLAALAALVVASAVTFVAPSIARADMPPDSCEGGDVGDPCTLSNLDTGTCQQDGNSLDCVAGGATTAAASTAAATTAAATTAASTGSGSTGAAGGGEEGSGGSSGGETEDEGCAVRAPRDKRTTHVGAAAVFALASAIAFARRLRQR